MVFTYTYRATSGVRKQATIEASSRADCFVRLKERGISPLAVKEGGWLELDDGEQTGQARTFTLKALVAGVLVVGLFVTVWFCFARSKRHEVPAKDMRVSKSNEPVVVKKDESVRSEKTIEVKRSLAEHARLSQNAVAADVTPPASNKFVRADIPEPKPLEDLCPPKRPVFPTSAEQLLAMATPPDPSQPVPPLPNLDGEDDKEELDKALNNVIVPTTNDTIASLQMKMNVVEQKEEFRKLRAEQGWTFKEYLTALREKHNEDAKYIAEAHRVNEENYNNPEMTDEDYLKQLKIINEGLRERGLPELE